MELEKMYNAEVPEIQRAGADLSLAGPAIAKGKIVKIETFFCIDLTTAAKTIRLGYNSKGTDWWIKRETLAAGVYGLALERPLILIDGERPIARVETCTANDECVMVARGPYI